MTSHGKEVLLLEEEKRANREREHNQLVSNIVNPIATITSAAIKGLSGYAAHNKRNPATTRSLHLQYTPGRFR